MASLYDYGIPENTNNMIKLLDVISMDNARKEQANYNKILEQKATFEMDQAKQKEALLSKKIRFGDWMDAKGYNPAVKSRTLKYGQGLGYIDQMGDVEIRNMPTLLKTLSEDNEYQLGIMEDNYGHANQQHEMAKQKLAEFEEKNPFWETDPKAKEERAKLALVQNQYARKVYNLQNSMNKLTGAKGETESKIDKPNPKDFTPESLSEYQKTGNAGVLERVKEEPKPDEYSDWGYGQKRNKRTGEIVRVPTAKESGGGGGDSDTDKKKIPISAIEGFRQVYQAMMKETKELENEYDEKQHRKNPEEYNAKVRALKSRYSNLFEPYRKYGLWHGWAGNSNTQTQPTAQKKKTLVPDGKGGYIYQ